MQIKRAVSFTRFSNFTLRRTLQTLSLTHKNNLNLAPCFDLNIEFPPFNGKTQTQISDSYVDLIRKCRERKSVGKLRSIHLHMKKSGFPLLSLGNKLVDAYIKCDYLDDARKLFDEMPHRHIVIWNSMISIYVRQKRSDEAIELYGRMILEGIIADEFTYSSIFKAFSDTGLLREGQKAHGRLLVSGLEVSNVFVGSALVDMYAKFGKLRDARVVSDQIVEKDVVLVTALIVGYTQNGEDGEALEIFRDMVKEGIRANDFTLASILTACGNLANMDTGKQVHGLLIKYGFEWAVESRTSLLTMYSKCGMIDDSLKVFDGFFNANLVSWTALVMGLVQNGRAESALSSFCEMIRNSIIPNAFTLSTVLRACSIQAMLTEGQQLQGLILKMGFDKNRFVGSALIDMYGKCGIIEMARSIFDDLNEVDVVSVNSMIFGYALGGSGEEAIKLFDQMEELGVRPNDGTFTSVLYACTNAGLLEDGRRIFSSMKRNPEINISRDHYTCMIDLLGRAGKLEEAETLLNQIQNPDVVLWRTLLSSCKVHGEVEMAERLMNHIIELEPGDEGAHVLLSNIYASTGNWDEVTKMKITMKEMKLKKNPAMSWIEVDGEVHTFMAGDLSHPRATEIDEELRELRDKIEGLGYTPDTRYVLQDLDEREKERSIYYHSEKIAIAFGILSSKKKNNCIRIFKNLRVCGDCHTWIKFVSKVIGREVIARDAKRFHHFKDGLCSCGDYW